jgi:hypothetical protein
MIKKLIKTYFLLAVLALPFIASAQTLPFAGPTLAVTLTPNSPGAYRTVTAEAQSYSVDLNQSNINWYVNDQLLASGRGNTSFSFKTGSLGSVTTLTVIANTTGGEIRVDRSLQTAEVDLIWEANTYTPVWYKGKALFTPTAGLTFTAIPSIITSDGTQANPRDVVYTWRQDGRVLGSQSGYGRNVFRISPSMIDESIRISVTAEVEDMKAQSAASVTLSGERVLVYKDDPLLGVLSNNAVSGAFELLEDEVSFRAFPLHFTTNSSSDLSLEYSWQLGNTVIPDANNVVTFKQTGEEGVARISLVVENKTNFLQKAVSAFDIIFGNTQVFR